MRFTLLIVLALCSRLISAQESPNPVSWTFSLNEAESAVELTATIEEGWHIYGLVLENDMGPLPTVLSFDEASAVWGEAHIPEPKEKFDDMFVMNVTYYEHAVTFKKEFSKRNGPLKGEVEFMVCNDEMCLPPTVVEFALP